MAILAVIVDGDPHPEGIEVRLRTRLALVSALGSMQYVPRDSEHIGCADVSWPRTADLVFQGSKPEDVRVSVLETSAPSHLHVPFERYRLIAGLSGRYQEIVVLWFREDDLGEHPLPRLALLRSGIEAFSADTTNRCPWLILGPHTSTGLQAMLGSPGETPIARGTSIVGKSAAAPSCLVSNWLAGVEIHCSSATMADPELVDNPHPVRNRKTVAARLASGYGIRFQNSAATDDELSKLLVSELLLRGVDPAVDPVAYITEWDTAYGRSLRETILRTSLAWTLQSASNGVSAAERNEAATMVAELPRRHFLSAMSHSTIPTNKISKYAFFRGLDGDLPPDSTNGGAGSLGAGGILEKSEGRPLLDYLRRLAQRMKDTQSARQERFKAIGILASDVYDKLVILQALRHEFPQALFFTTDLDSRLLEARHYDYTRNLLVASGYGLRLERIDGNPEKGPGRPLPPFRDAYQTALFRACCLALSTDPGRFIREFPISPRVFELGRSRAIALKPPYEPAFSVLDKFAAWAVRPGTGLLWGFRIPRFVAMASLAAGVLGMLFWAAGFRIAWGAPRSSTPDETPGRSLRRVQVPTLALVAFAGILLLLYGNDGLEPSALVVWTEGVSLWPTEVMRLISCLFCTGALVTAVFGYSRCLQSLEHEFHLSEGDQSRGVAAIWASFRQASHWKSHLRQTMVLAALYALLVFGIFWLAGEVAVPFRGERAYRMDHGLGWLSGSLLALLTIYVAVATRSVAVLVGQKFPNPEDWPEPLLKQIQKERGLPRELADGWLHLRLLGPLTARVGSLIYFPVAALFMLFWAHSPWFDHWTLGSTLGWFLAVNAVVIVLCGLVVQRQAEKARAIVIGKLQRQLQIALSSPASESRAPLVENLIADVASYRVGAFAPVLDQAFVMALLIPLGGSGSISILERLLHSA